jgi:hypothetical protein
MWLNGTGINLNEALAIYGIQGGAQTAISASGTTAGTITGAQNTIFGITQVVLNFSGYVNSGATNQTVDFPYSFTQIPTVGSNDTGLVISATVSGITITSPDSATIFTGNVIIFGV